LSIDENRRDFKRVGWGQRDSHRPNRDEHGNIMFEQVWFAGNHSDVGGSYPENESRLSDITLQWMLDRATAIPNGLKFDPRVLNSHCDSDGRQHDEVAAGMGLVTTLLGITWTEENRSLPTDSETQTSSATMHRTVYERFDAAEVMLYKLKGAYRPKTLRAHVDFQRYYKAGAPFPADSISHATCLAA
jgi:hypothetical protein